MIRVLIAEDSPTVRELLSEILASDPEIEIVGCARDGVDAVAMTRRLRPDVVTMDIRMPRMDGFEATRQIMSEAPTPIVIVSGSVDVRDVVVSMHALRAGALTVLPKPVGPAAEDFPDHAKRVVDTVKAMSQVKVVRRWSRAAPVVEDLPRALPGEGARARVIAIAASTGGPAALARIFGDMPADIDAPILVVQHITLGFVAGFAAWLDSVSDVRVRIAADGELLRPRTAYLAPDDHHLGVSADRRRAVLSRAPPIEGFRPSATYLFESVARAFGSAVAAVILTGMGRDGVEGLRAVHGADGHVFAQDEATSVVYGMPQAAAAAGLVDRILPLGAVARGLSEVVVRGASGSGRGNVGGRRTT